MSEKYSSYNELYYMEERSKREKDFSRWFTCPICDGEGGEKEVILDDGTGPYYPCNFCHTTGKVKLFEWLKYKWWELKGEI